MKNVTKLMIAFLAFAVLGTACSKYPGFKKDKQGFYYKFYIENKKEVQPQIGDLVEMVHAMELKDSVLFENEPLTLKILESLFAGDVFAAIQKMHLGDSAIFIIDGKKFFEYFIEQDYPFDSNDLYFTFKLNKILPKEEFEAMQAERTRQYEAIMEEYRLAEDSLINNYITTNKIKVKPTEEGIYFVKKVSGNGKAITNGSTVSVHYTGKFLDGYVFDSSIDSGAPFTLTVGNGQVIPGWEKTLLLMKGGDKATVLIPSKLAYGSRGADYVIPPYTPLIFDMEIMSVE
ncbi:MAG: FKBP-type peptidyl-prolyl cis-trans isomerase [Lentimicrobiaceae bacterium]|nr:FKBP-type peptidyl-prolyl cis-trans isomerase [Lentimicrobiaceae bacterium]